MAFRCALITLVSFFALSVQAEYRAFSLAVTNTETGQSRTVISTLDHIQYPGYYPVNKGEVVTYLDSWMCWDDSPHFTATCAKPESKDSDQDPKIVGAYQP